MSWTPTASSEFRVPIRTNKQGDRKEKGNACFSKKWRAIFFHLGGRTLSVVGWTWHKTDLFSWHVFNDTIHKTRRQDGEGIRQKKSFSRNESHRDFKNIYIISHSYTNWHIPDCQRKMCVSFTTKYSTFSKLLQYELEISVSSSLDSSFLYVPPLFSSS